MTPQELDAALRNLIDEYPSKSRIVTVIRLCKVVRNIRYTQPMSKLRGVRFAALVDDVGLVLDRYLASLVEPQPVEFTDHECEFCGTFVVHGRFHDCIAKRPPPQPER